MPGPGTLWGFEVSSPSSLQLPQQPRLPPLAPRKGRPCTVSELGHQQGHLLTQISCTPERSSPLQPQMGSIFHCAGVPACRAASQGGGESQKPGPGVPCPWESCSALSQVWRGLVQPSRWSHPGDVLSCHPPKKVAVFHTGEAESSSIESSHVHAAGSQQGEKLPGWQGSVLPAQVIPLETFSGHSLSTLLCATCQPALAASSGHQSCPPSASALRGANRAPPEELIIYTAGRCREEGRSAAGR